MTEEQTTVRLIDFDELADLFVEQGALVSPAELHGSLCGTLAAGSRMSEARWLTESTELLGVDELNIIELKEALIELYQVTLNQLETQGFDLQLLVPADEEAIAQRATSLGGWCHGFLSGYTLAGGSQADGLSEDARDALADFAQIVHISAEDDEAGGEADFAEVSEYVRMAALLLFSELNRGREEDCPPPGTALH